MISLDMTNEQIVDALAAGNLRALNILTKVRRAKEEVFRLIAIDLADMLLSGEQIVQAMAFYKGDVAMFIAGCAARDAAMIQFVNERVPTGMARTHSEQKKIPPVDTAIKKMIEDAKADNRLRIIDEGAEVVNEFFINMIIEMQKRKHFTSNLRVNLGLEAGAWAVFAITLTEFIGSDGKPMTHQPQNEPPSVIDSNDPTVFEQGKGGE